MTKSLGKTAKRTGRPRLYASDNDRVRACRARKAAARRHQIVGAPAPIVVIDHADPVGELATWATDTLIIPPGIHSPAGRWCSQTSRWRGCGRRGTRMKARSARRGKREVRIAAILALGYLVGPLRRPGWRGAIASLDKNKAGELRRQCAEIAEASGLDVKVRRSPYPGMIESSTGSLDTLSADKSAGHASGYDLVIVDETGLFPLRARDLLAGLRSSVSARGGRIRHISIRGASILFREILDNPAVVSHVYAAPDGCAIDDEAAWHAANPGLGIIKSIAYMESEVARVRGVASDEPSFRAYDLNETLSPTREMVCSPDDLSACFTEAPIYNGPCYVGLDIGEAGSGTAAVGFWPDTGALRTWLAFGDVPDLDARGKRDGADYRKMQRRGELTTYLGRTVPPAAFVLDVRDALGDAQVVGAVADGYRAAELRDCCPWALETVRSGTGPDGSQAVRAFQRAILTRAIAAADNVSLASAIKESVLRRDGNGNPAVDKSRSAGRIDVLSAAVLAVGAAVRWPRPQPFAMASL